MKANDTTFSISPSGAEIWRADQTSEINLKNSLAGKMKDGHVTMDYDQMDYDQMKSWRDSDYKVQCSGR